MRSIKCNSCGEVLYSAASPRAGTRCPACSARLMAVWAGDVGEREGRSRGLAHIPHAAPGSYPGDRPTFPSLQAFLLADARRVPSAERDVGLHWRDTHGRFFRAAWVAATGELYTVQSGPPEHGGGHVEVLGLASSEPALRSALAGWDDICGEPGSIDWLRERATRELDSAGASTGAGDAEPSAPALH